MQMEGMVGLATTRIRDRQLQQLAVFSVTRRLNVRGVSVGRRVHEEREVRLHSCRHPIEAGASVCLRIVCPRCAEPCLCRPALRRRLLPAPSTSTAGMPAGARNAVAGINRVAFGGVRGHLQVHHRHSGELCPHVVQVIADGPQSVDSPASTASTRYRRASGGNGGDHVGTSGRREQDLSGICTPVLIVPMRSAFEYRAVE